MNELNQFKNLNTLCTSSYMNELIQFKHAMYQQLYE